MKDIQFKEELRYLTYFIQYLDLEPIRRLILHYILTHLSLRLNLSEYVNLLLVNVVILYWVYSERIYILSGYTHLGNDTQYLPAPVVNIDQVPQHLLHPGPDPRLVQEQGLLPTHMVT